MAFLSTKSWHWHLTKQIKGLRSNETPGNMINHSILSLVQQYSDYIHFHWCVRDGGRKKGGWEGLGSCLTLSTLLLDPKLDCQKLRHCRNEYFIVCSPLTTNFMSQNRLKIEHPEIGNTCYGCQNLRTMRHLQRETPEEVSF